MLYTQMRRGFRPGDFHHQREHFVLYLPWGIEDRGFPFFEEEKQLAATNILAVVHLHPINRMMDSGGRQPYVLRS